MTGHVPMGCMAGVQHVGAGSIRVVVGIGEHASSCSISPIISAEQNCSHQCHSHRPQVAWLSGLKPKCIGSLSGQSWATAPSRTPQAATGRF